MSAPLVKQPSMILGVRGDRPDGVVTALLVDQGGTSVELEMRWRLAVDLGTGLLAQAIRASNKAGIGDAEWSAYVAGAFAFAAGDLP